MIFTSSYKKGNNFNFIFIIQRVYTFSLYKQLIRFSTRIGQLYCIAFGLVLGEAIFYNHASH
jgi:hypothetical protein